MASMKPGGSAYHLMGKGLTPPEQVTRAKLHLPGSEKSAGLCQLLQMSVPQGSEASAFPTPVCPPVSAH